MHVNLDRLITIERRVDGKDSKRAATYTWETLATVYAERMDAVPSRSESVRQGLAVGERQRRYRIRWRNDIDSTMRVLEGSEVLQIIGGPSEIGPRRSFLEIFCSVYTSKGGS